MRLASLMLVIGILATAPLVTAGEGHGSHDGPDLELTIVAQEEGCGPDASFCYNVTEGSLQEADPGDSVRVNFENHGETDHELMVRTLNGTQIAPQQESDHGGNGTQGGDDGNETSHHGGGGHGGHLVPPGGSRTITFTVPDDADGIYLWCSLSGHEEAGMAQVAAFHAASSADPGSEQARQTPGLSAAFVGLALVSGAGLARRRSGT